MEVCKMAWVNMKNYSSTAKGAAIGAVVAGPVSAVAGGMAGLAKTIDKKQAQIA